MPRLQHLEELNQNRTYAINATVKYMNRGERGITGILEQEGTQTKFCVKNKDINMDQGSEYLLDRCFYGNNGWLYVRDPVNTIHQSQDKVLKAPMELKQLYENRNNFVNSYVTVALQVVSKKDRKLIEKDGERLTLDILTCFGNGALIDVNIWNQNVPKEIQYKWLLFDGFKLKFSGPDSMCLNSSVYSKTQMMMTPSCEQYSTEKTYKNLSSLVQERNVTAINALSQLHEKLFSEAKVSISDIKVCEYDGCGKCRRKLTEEGNCTNCGLVSEIEKKVYK